ncbi:substrate-binding periplasmic protein [Thiohalocapsa marina]|nr:ABC transporter substrate-binding protein [Thiohalocapsa marina]
MTSTTLSLHRAILARARRLAAICCLLVWAPVLAGPLQLMTEDWPPFNYEKDGEVKGISVAIVRAIQQEIGDDSSIRILPWNRAYALTLHTPGTALFSAVRLEEREALFKWVSPLMETEYYFFENRDAPTGIRSIEDAKQVPMIAASISTNSDYIRLSAMGFTNLSQLDTISSPARLLLYKRADLGVMSPLTQRFQEFQAGMPDQLVNTGVLAYSQPLAIAFNLKTDDARIRVWQQALDGLRRSGALKRITAEALEEAEADYAIAR